MEVLLYICVCVCVYIYIYIYMCVCMCVCACVLLLDVLHKRMFAFILNIPFKPLYKLFFLFFIIIIIIIIIIISSSSSSRLKTLKSAIFLSVPWLMICWRLNL